jgi:AcrR family transcriptional regulator
VAVESFFSIFEAAELESAEPVAGEVAGRWPDVREAALTLFSRLGYHGTTMKDVANELGVRAPSLYNHIDSKQEILQRIVVVGMERALAYQQAAIDATDDVHEQLRWMTAAHVLIHIRHRRSAVVGDRELANLDEPVREQVRARRELYESRFRAVIERGVREGAFHVNSSKLASFAVIELASSVSAWFREDGPLTDYDVALEYAQMALRIVGADEARQAMPESAPAGAAQAV